MCVTCNEVVHQGCRNAENSHKKVAHSKVEDKEVCDCSHVSVLQYDQTYQAIPHHAKQEDEEVGQGQAGGNRSGVLIVRVVYNAGEVGDVTAIYDGIQQATV